jgi:hypothetical protein
MTMSHFRRVLFERYECAQGRRVATARHGGSTHLRGGGGPDPESSQNGRRVLVTTSISAARRRDSPSRQHAGQRGDLDIRTIDRALRSCEQLRGRATLNSRRSDRTIEITHGDPRTVMCIASRATARRRCESLREITACDRERTDQLAAVIGEHACEVGDRWCGCDHRAKRWMVLERVGRASLHGEVPHFTARANS